MANASSNFMYFDVKIEAILPRVRFCYFVIRFKLFIINEGILNL